MYNYYEKKDIINKGSNHKMRISSDNIPKCYDPVRFRSECGTECSGNDCPNEVKINCEFFNKKILVVKYE